MERRCDGENNWEWRSLCVLILRWAPVTGILDLFQFCPAHLNFFKDFLSCLYNTWKRTWLVQSYVNWSCWTRIQGLYKRHINKDGGHDSSSKVKPMCLDRPLVAGCSMGHKSWLLHVSGWDKKSKSNIADWFLPGRRIWITSSGDERK